MNNDATKNNDGEGDAEKMRLAFETFMLTGNKHTPEENNDDSSSLATSQSAASKSKKKKKKKKSSLGTPPISPTPSSASSTVQTPQSQKQLAKVKSDKKRYYQLLRSFNDKVQQMWLDIDDQILSILQNIVSIRGRLPLEWKLLHSSRGNVDSPEGNSQDDDGWKYHGFLGKPKEAPYSFHLQISDIELALSNDLIQHEKMLGGVRSLMSNLAECQDALGRVVDTLWKFHLECTEGRGEEMGNKEEDDDMERIVQNVTNLFHMLSMELYRKQCLVPMIIDSIEDEILGVEEQVGGDVGDYGRGNSSSSNNGLSGLATARKCYNSWKRSAEESCIDEVLISQLGILDK